MSIHALFGFWLKMNPGVVSAHMIVTWILEEHRLL